MTTIVAHFPSVVQGVDPDEWVVYCAACSAQEENWVPVCKHLDEHDLPWPPHILIGKDAT